VLTNLSSGDIKAKEGDLVTLMCSAQGEPPITFSWEKDKKPLESLVEINNPRRSSLLVVTMKDETSFGKYTCYVRDRFKSTTHTIWIQKQEVTGNTIFLKERCKTNKINVNGKVRSIHSIHLDHFKFQAIVKNILLEL
jgi:hypothetical protein